jgi:hypothetical protein
VSIALALLLVTAAAAQPATPTPPKAVEAAQPTRVFVAQITTGAQADASVVSLLSDAILVAARRHALRFEVMGVEELRGALDHEAMRRNAGCDTASCAGEIADALDAPQIVTGQLGRVGGRWLLTLTRTDRRSFKVLMRTQRTVKGETPEDLLEAIPGQVDELFGGAPLLPAPTSSSSPTSDAGAMTTSVPGPGLSPLAWSGIASAGLGVVGAAAGGVAHWLSWQSFDAGQEARARLAVDEVLDAKARGETELVLAFVGYGVGAGVLVAGGALLAWDAVSGSAETAPAEVGQ